jgi:sec-independent protein translocase protein TatA
MNLPALPAFSLGGPEMIGLVFLALLLFGAKKLPELARGVGRSLGEFKRAKEEFSHEIERAADEAERPKKAEGTVSHSSDSKTV